MTEDSKPVQTISVTSIKSIFISLILTFFFGALSMLYSTIWGAIIMTIVGIIILLVTFAMGVFLIWPRSMNWGALITISYNKKQLTQIVQ